MSEFKSRLKVRETMVGAIVTLAAPEVAEIMAIVGFDFLWIDMEHTRLDFSHVQAILQAVAKRSACLVRIPELNESSIKKVLDMGADGIIVPQVKSAEQARKAVEYCYYPPIGMRGAGVARAQQFGMQVQDYLAESNQKISLILQIESREGAENLPEILQIHEIDALFVGPLDMSGSLGVLGQTRHPRVQEIIKIVLRECQAAGFSAGIFTTDIQTAKSSIQQGFNLIGMGIDVGYLWQSARAALVELRA